MAEIARIELSTPFIQYSVSRDDAIKSNSVGPISGTYRDTAPAITYWPQVLALLTDFAIIGIVPMEVTIGVTQHEMGADDLQAGLNPFDYPAFFNLIKSNDPGYTPSPGSSWPGSWPGPWPQQ